MNKSEFYTVDRWLHVTVNVVADSEEEAIQRADILINQGIEASTPLRHPRGLDIMCDNPYLFRTETSDGDFVAQHVQGGKLFPRSCNITKGYI